MSHFRHKIKAIVKLNSKLTIAFKLNFTYGNFGNWSKSGLRFSLNASLPSLASSVV